MKAIRTMLFAMLIALMVCSAATPLLADGPVGVYAMVQKVVMEPNEQMPSRIQIWGVFVWVDGGVKTPGPINLPQRGYLYFKLPENPAQAAAAKMQWGEIKTLAGTSQVIAFGNWNYAGPFEDLYIPAPGNSEEVRVRKQNETPAKAITYPAGMGLMKIANDKSHADLINLMKAFLQK
jgi:hypothetical protein